MAVLQEATIERKVRSQPARVFTTAAKELEDLILVGLKEEEIEAAMTHMMDMYGNLNKLHQAYLAARQGDEE